ncbi:MAG: hypothetical protein ACRCWF_09255, partial [Beijerinckiaceae bacterium]
WSFKVMPKQNGLYLTSVDEDLIFNDLRNNDIIFTTITDHNRLKSFDKFTTEEQFSIVYFFKKSTWAQIENLNYCLEIICKNYTSVPEYVRSFIYDKRLHIQGRIYDNKIEKNKEIYKSATNKVFNSFKKHTKLISYSWREGFDAAEKKYERRQFLLERDMV